MGSRSRHQHHPMLVVHELDAEGRTERVVATTVSAGDMCGERRSMKNKRIDMGPVSGN